MHVFCKSLENLFSNDFVSVLKRKKKTEAKLDWMIRAMFSKRNTIKCIGFYHVNKHHFL